MGGRAAAVALLLSPGFAVAADTTVIHAEWAGTYRMARAADLQRFKPEGQKLDDLIMAHLQPWAIEKIKWTNGVADDTGAVCQLAGLFRHPSTVGGIIWIPEQDKIIMASTALAEAGVRRIRLNGVHPKMLPALYLGDSVGHWEGDTLVVDTKGFNDRTWLMSGIEPHSEAMHVIEHIRIVGDGTLMEVRTTVEDRETLTSPYSYSRYYKKTNPDVPENICNGDEGEQELRSGFRNKALTQTYIPADEKGK
jgi:hypothetical protein